MADVTATDDPQAGLFALRDWLKAELARTATEAQTTRAAARAATQAARAAQSRASQAALAHTTLRQELSALAVASTAPPVELTYAAFQALPDFAARDRRDRPIVGQRWRYDLSNRIPSPARLGGPSWWLVEAVPNPKPPPWPPLTLRWYPIHFRADAAGG